jgi:hypothetical protein
MGCWAAGFVLREPCEEVNDVAKLLVRLALDDPHSRVQSNALLALRDNDWTRCAEVVLMECIRIHQQGNHDHESVRRRVDVLSILTAYVRHDHITPRLR